MASLGVELVLVPGAIVRLGFATAAAKDGSCPGWPCRERATRADAESATSALKRRITDASPDGRSTTQPYAGAS